MPFSSSVALAMMVNARAVAAAFRCEEWCAEPCTALNGDVSSECSECTSTFACHPDAEGYNKLKRPKHFGPSDRTHRVEVSPTGVDQKLSAEPWCFDKADRDQCLLWAVDGGCRKHEKDMSRHCARTCQLCELFVGRSKCARGPCLDKYSIFDEKLDWDQADEPCSATAQLMRDEHRCEWLEDEQRVRDRGYFVIRNAVPPEELAAMREYVHALPHAATRMLCGASDVQVGCDGPDYHRCH